MPNKREVVRIGDTVTNRDIYLTAIFRENKTSAVDVDYLGISNQSIKPFVFDGKIVKSFLEDIPSNFVVPKHYPALTLDNESYGSYKDRLISYTRDTINGNYRLTYEYIIPEDVLKLEIMYFSYYNLSKQKAITGVRIFKPRNHYLKAKCVVLNIKTPSYLFIPVNYLKSYENSR